MRAEQGCSTKAHNFVSLWRPALPKSLEVPDDTQLPRQPIPGRREIISAQTSSDLDGPSRRKEALGDTHDEPRVSQLGWGGGRKCAPISP